MSNTATDIAYYIPAKYRKVGYTVLTVLGLILGATTAGFLAAGAGLPVALIVAQAVFGYVSTAFHFVARVNVAPESLSAPR